jgi:hypothetical protein
MMRPRWHVARALSAVALLAVGALAAFEGLWRCPVAWLFRVPCPSCGLTRAGRALLQLRWGDAVRIHPVAPLVFALVAAWSARMVWLLARTGETRGLTSGPVGLWLTRLFVLAVALEVAVWVARAAGFLGGPVPV